MSLIRGIPDLVLQERTHFLEQKKLRQEAMLLNGEDQLVPRLLFQKLKTRQTEKEFSTESRFVCERHSRKGNP